MISAFAARQRLALGQVNVADKAGEIVAIPKLLDLFAIEGAVVNHRGHGLPERRREEDPRPARRSR